MKIKLFVGLLCSALVVQVQAADNNQEHQDWIKQLENGLNFFIKQPWVNDDLKVKLKKIEKLESAENAYLQNLLNCYGAGVIKANEDWLNWFNGVIKQKINKEGAVLDGNFSTKEEISSGLDKLCLAFYNKGLEKEQKTLQDELKMVKEQNTKVNEFVNNKIQELDILDQEGQVSGKSLENKINIIIQNLQSKKGIEKNELQNSIIVNTQKSSFLSSPWTKYTGAFLGGAVAAIYLKSQFEKGRFNCVINPLTGFVNSAVNKLF